MKSSKVRNFATLFVVVGVLLGAFFAFRFTRDRMVTRHLTQSPPPAILPAGYHSTVGSPLANELNAWSGNATTDLAILHDLLGQFTTTFPPASLPPMGDNQDVVAALTGRNARHLVFLPRDHPLIDAKGRLLDRWGTPYFFHARSAGVFDLRSAGPDRVLFNQDDIVLER